MDSFYASCELKNNPGSKDKPFIVGSDPREGRGRGVVLTANYVAKRLGIHSGMPISKAWKLCPEGHYVQPDFELYGLVSSRIMEVIRPFGDKMEQVSIDEAYVDVTERLTKTCSKSEDVWKSGVIEDLAQSIKKSIFKREQITCSIGVSNSKILAKIATDFRKPDRLTIVEPARVREFLSPLLVGKIPGIGKVSQKILEEKYDVKTIADLSAVDLEDLKESFGRSATWFKLVAEGREFSEVVENWEPKSLSGETTFEEDETDYSKIREAMHVVATDVYTRATNRGYYFSNVGIKIRFTGFETHTRSKSLPMPTDSMQTLVYECDRMLEEFSKTNQKGIRLIGVRISSLRRMKQEQATLLDFGATNI